MSLDIYKCICHIYKFQVIFINIAELTILAQTAPHRCVHTHVHIVWAKYLCVGGGGGGNRGGRAGVKQELCVSNCLVNKNFMNFN